MDSTLKLRILEWWENTIWCMPNRLIRFKLRFTQCRYCIHLININGYDTKRLIRSTLLMSGECEVTHKDVCYDELRKWNRCDMFHHRVYDIMGNPVKFSALKKTTYNSCKSSKWKWLKTIISFIPYIKKLSP